MRRSRVLTRAVSWAMSRLARERFRCDQADSTGVELGGVRRWQRKVPVGTSSIGRRDRGPHAEPLLGAVGFEPLYLGESSLRREAHRVAVRGLGKERVGR